jgi:hypothetical protein
MVIQPDPLREVTRRCLPQFGRPTGDGPPFNDFAAKKNGLNGQKKTAMCFPPTPALLICMMEGLPLNFIAENPAQLLIAN